MVGYQTTYINDKEYTPLWRGAGTSPTLGFFIKDMKELKCITIYPEVYHNDNLTPNEKIYLSVVRYYTVRGKKHLCGFSDKVMSEELLIGVRQIQNIKSKLKKLGLIIITEKGIKYVSQNNDNKPLNNDTMSQNNDNKPLNNDTMSQNNDTNPCNTDENQQVTKGNKENKINKKNKEKNKENKENKATDESLDDFLSSWEEDALKGKQEYQQAKKDNSCDVVDMVMGLQYKEETTPKEEPIKEQYIDKSSIIQRMISLIDHWIGTEIVNNNKRTPSEKERLLKENTYNKNQLEKFFGEYILNKDLNKMNDNEQYFTNITENAFRTYKIRIKSEAKKVSQKNPYSDLEENNTYKETDRWKK